MSLVSEYLENVRKTYRENKLATVLYLFFMGSAVSLLFESSIAIYLYYTRLWDSILYIPIVHGVLVVFVAILREEDVNYVSERASQLFGFD